MLKRNIDREPKQCYVDQKTHPQYRQAASKFTFLFNATSPLKPSGKISIHKVNHLEIGKKAVFLSVSPSFKYSHIFSFFMHKTSFTYFLVFRPLIRIVSPIAQYRVLSPSSNCPPHSRHWGLFNSSTLCKFPVMSPPPHRPVNTILKV